MTREDALKVAKPILFNGEMVRGILDGRKTATRRIVKFLERRNPKWTGYVKDGLTLYNGRNEPCNEPCQYRLLDILYVRETWTCHEGAIDGIIYKARCPEKHAESKKWHPSIHMPKDAARIFLGVTDIRLERLQKMETEDDKNYIAEGAQGKHDFIRIWDSTVKDRELYGWYANPWVWVIEFEVLEVE